jgi:hypothetical protein
MMLSDPVESSGIVGKNFPFDLRIEALHRFEPGNRASSLLEVRQGIGADNEVCRTINRFSSCCVPARVYAKRGR